MLQAALSCPLYADKESPDSIEHHIPLTAGRPVFNGKETVPQKITAVFVSSQTQ